MTSSPNPNRSSLYATATLLTLTAITLIAGYLLAGMLRPMFAPLFLALITALMAYPYYSKLVNRLGQRRYWAATLTTTLLTLLIILPILLIISATIGELGLLVERAKQWASSHHVNDLSQLIAHPYVQKLLDYAETYLNISPDTLRQQAISWAGKLGAMFSASTLNIIADLPSSFLAMALYGLGLFFFLADGPAGLKAWRKISPLRPVYEERIWADFRSVCRSSVLGTLFSALAQAGLFALTMTIIVAVSDVTFGSWIFLLTALTLIAAMLPVLGAALTWVPVAIYYLVTGKIVAAVIMIISGLLLISTADNVIRAWALKDSSDMHPLYGLVLVIGGIHLFGPIGIFLGPIVGTLFLSLLKLIKDDVQGKVR